MEAKESAFMQSDEDKKMIFENLDEWLNDEGKIVTYRWLSLTLGLHVNYAKQILELFAKNERDKGHTLSITYCIGGFVTQNDTEVYKVTVAQEDLRQKVVSTLLPPVSCHIYSIQKSRLKSSDVLYTADIDLIKSSGYDLNKYSSIECRRAKLRTAKPCTELVNGCSSETTANSPSTIKPSVSSSPAVQSGTALKKTSSVDASKETADSGGKQSDKSTAGNKSNTGFSRLFAGSVGKQKTEPTSSKPSNAQTASPPVSAVNSRTQAADGDAQHSAKSTSNGTVNAKNKSASDTSSHAVKTKSLAENKKKDTKADKGVTKRRRIVIETSSSEDEEDVVISPTPSPEPVALPAPDSPAEMQTDAATAAVAESEPMEAESSTTQLTKVQRKLVSKTYVNDEGFMVTEKVWENEVVSTDNKPSTADVVLPTEPVKTSAPAKSTTKTPAASASSDTVPQKKKSAEKKAAKNSSSGKQSSLMTFFQKK